MSAFPRPSPATIAAWERHAGASVEPDRLRASLAIGNLPQAFNATAVSAGEKVAATIDGASATYRELDQAAGRIAAWLRARGVEPGDRVFLCGPNSLAFVFAYLGTLRAGAVVVLAGADLTERELSHMVDHSGAVAGFAAGDAHERLRTVTKGSGLNPLVALDLERSPTLEEASRGSDSLAPPDVGGGEVAVIGYTSGTTGAPKGAALSHSNVLASLRGIMIAWRWVADDVLVHALPMSHQHGMAGLQLTLLAGSRAVIQRRFEPEALCAAIEQEEATVLFSVPAIYERLLSASRADTERASVEATRAGGPQTAGGTGDRDQAPRVVCAQFESLRLATSGSAPLPPNLWKDAAALIGSEPLERYGTTESGLDVSNPYAGPRKPGAVGIPLPGCEMRVVDAEGAELEAGADGEVVVRGPQVLASYWVDDAATRESFFDGGWFRTGDVGRIDPEDGYLAITGRTKELIISGGLNVYPREVELVLEAHPSVSRAAVVGVPSERWGEAVVAVVVPEGGKTEPDELQAYAREHLAPYKCPKAVLEADALPFDGFGKLRRAELVQMAKEELV